MNFKRSVILRLVGCFVALGIVFLSMNRSEGREGTPILEGGIGEVTGAIFFVTLTSSEILSGKTIYGAVISNGTGQSEVTATLVSAVKGESFIMHSKSGSTPINLKFFSGDTIEGMPDFNSALDYIQLDGSIMEDQITLLGTGVSTWAISSVSGSPTVYQF